jgi:type III secretory pathway component EscS
MDTTASSIRKVVAILTAILSEQEETAYEMVLESNPIELFSALTGVLLSALQTIAKVNGQEVGDYLKHLGMSAFDNEY